MNDLRAFISSKHFGRLLLYGIGALVLFYGGIYLWLGIYTRHGDFIKVPDLTNKSLADIRDQLEDEGFKIEISDSSTYDSKKQGVNPLTYFEMNDYTLQLTNDTYQVLNALMPAGNRIGLVAPKVNSNNKQVYTAK